MTNKDIMLIGELSSRTGVSRDTLRFYEKEGLILSNRKENDYRDYDEKSVERLRLIAQLQALGFSLKEITTFFSFWQSKEASCSGIVFTLKDKLSEIQRQIDHLMAARQELAATLALCDNDACCFEKSAKAIL